MAAKTSKTPKTPKTPKSTSTKESKSKKGGNVSYVRVHSREENDSFFISRALYHLKRNHDTILILS